MESRKRTASNSTSFPISIEWNIKEESLLKETDFCSLIQAIPINRNIEYFLQLETNRVDKDKNGDVCCYLNLRMKEKMEIYTEIKMKCESANYKTNWNYTYNEGKTGIGQRICSKADFFNSQKKYIVDGHVTIKVDALLTFKFDEEGPILPKLLKEKCLGSLLWENDEDKDIIIEVEKKQIKAHKYVLKRRSPAFAKLLNIKDENNPNQNILKIEGYLYEIVQNAIMFCYDVPNNGILTDEDLTDLLSFSNKYEIIDLKQNIEKIIIEKLSVSNVTIFANQSITTKAENLYKKCVEFLVDAMKNSKAVSNIEKLDSSIKEKLLEKAFSNVQNS